MKTRTMKKLATLLMAAAMMAMTAMTALAAPTVTIYGKSSSGGYVENVHSSSFIDSIDEVDDNVYEITFKPIAVGSSTGYISSMTIDGVEYSADDDGILVAEFTYNATDVEDSGIVGQAFTFAISMGDTVHASSAGILVISE